MGGDWSFSLCPPCEGGGSCVGGIHGATRGLCGLRACFSGLGARVDP